LDAFSLRAVAAAELALRDAEVTISERERIGVILATGYGSLVTSFTFLDDVIEKGDRRGSPILFASSVHSAPTSAISSLLDIRGPTLTVTGMRGAWTDALWLALDWLAHREVDLVLLAGADAFHEALGYRLLADGGWAEEGLMSPLDFENASFVPGETFAVMALGHPEDHHGRWGHIEEPRACRVPDESGPLLLSSTGRMDEAKAYAPIATHAKAAAAYAPLWGGNPTAPAMTCLSAALSLTDERLYPVPEGQVSPGVRVMDAGLELPSELCCCSLDGVGSCLVVTVRAPA
jgi:hypothetical protein